MRFLDCFGPILPIGEMFEIQPLKGFVVDRLNFVSVSTISADIAQPETGEFN
jgi:hypothetical protein